MTATEDDDRPLVEAAQADPARFVELYDRYVGRVFAYVSRRTGDRSATEDITSEVFERVLAQLGRFEWRGVPFSAWLFRIAANAIADRWRKNHRESDALPDDLPDPREHDDIERRLIVFDLVDRLPDVQRQVIRMRYAEDKSIREIAAAIGRSEGAVKQLQVRAFEHLRKGMGRND